MKVYFAANPKAPAELQKIYLQVIDLLYSAGVTVLSNLTARHISGFSSADLEKMEQTGEGMVEQIDGIIIEATKDVPEGGYLTAIGLAHHKPILFLFQGKKEIDPRLLAIKKEPTAAKLLNLRNYRPEELEKAVVNFLGRIEEGTGREKASIKFTLRVTKKIERYLQWKTHNTKNSKADYLREMIEGLISKDQEFQKFIADNK